MSQLNQLVVLLACDMWAWSQLEKGPLSKRQIYHTRKKQSDSKIGNISLKRVSIAIDSLVKNKMLSEVDINSQDEVTYEISIFGIEWVEDWFHVVPTDSWFAFYQRYNDALIIGQSRARFENSVAQKKASNHERLMSEIADINWPKWGVIVAMIVGVATVAIMKGWL